MGKPRTFAQSVAGTVLPYMKTISAITIGAVLIEVEAPIVVLAGIVSIAYGVRNAYDFLRNN